MPECGRLRTKGAGGVEGDEPDKIKQSFASNVKELNFHPEYKRNEFLPHCKDCILS